VPGGVETCLQGGEERGALAPQLGASVRLDEIGASESEQINPTVGEIGPLATEDDSDDQGGRAGSASAT